MTRDQSLPQYMARLRQLGPEHDVESDGPSIGYPVALCLLLVASVAVALVRGLW